MTELLFSLSFSKRKIQYDVLFQNRKTISISVHPDCSVLVKAPETASVGEVWNRVEKRKRWVLRQVRYFEQFQPRTTPRKYISGETHLYLGRHYRLKLIEGKSSNVKLKQGRLMITLPFPAEDLKVKSLLEDWYRDKLEYHATKLLDRHIRGSIGIDGVEGLVLKIRNMKTKWGSMSSRNALTLNLQLARAPRECIEYVIVHELCHLVQLNHSKEFYELLERHLPDWQNRKHKLELTLV